MRSQRDDQVWAKTSVSNLVQYVPSGRYFARLRVSGKLIWKSLKTDKLSGRNFDWPTSQRSSARGRKPKAVSVVVSSHSRTRSDYFVSDWRRTKASRRARRSIGASALTPF